ncbi:MAG: arsenate reductase/protein-tyrosine-phosphatase family protein [Candidatus Limnocylindria bacterium]
MPTDDVARERIRAATHPQRYRLLRLLADGNRTASELAHTAGMAPSLVSHHLGTLSRLRLVTVQRDRRERRYALDAQAIAGAAGDVLGALTGARRAPVVAPLPRVLFLCRHNAGRSQMALAFFERFAKGRAIVDSAGSEPGTAVHEVVLNAMNEQGFSIDRRPQRVTPAMLRDADVVVDMGCGEDLSAVPASRRRSWRIADPHGKSVESVRRIRDRIAARTELLAHELIA